MKLRYYADAPNADNHERIIDLLYTISDKYGIPVEIERVNNRFGWIQVFPGEIRESSPEEVYDRDFHYNRTLGSNIDDSPSQAFKASGRHVDIDGYVGIIDDGLVWATTHRGDPIGYGPDIDEEATTLGFLDRVAKHGLDVIESKYMDADERERSVLDRFLASSTIGGTVHRDVTVGSSLVPDHPAHGEGSSVAELITRTVEAVIETEDTDWVVHTGKTLDPETLDTALGHIFVRDRLYRRDNDLAPEETSRAIVFNTVPWELDIDAVPEALRDISTETDAGHVHLFVGQGGEFQRIVP